MRKSSFTAPAKFSGKCADCQSSFKVGEMVRCVPVGQGWKRYHVDCPTNTMAVLKAATPKERKQDLTIEPCRGQTYNRPDQVAVYEYGVYPRSSVLAGQTKRVFLDSFDSLEEAKKAYPTARVSDSLYEATRPSLSHLPDNDLGDMENHERECLRREMGH